MFVQRYCSGVSVLSLSIAVKADTYADVYIDIMIWPHGGCLACGRKASQLSEGLQVSPANTSLDLAPSSCWFCGELRDSGKAKQGAAFRSYWSQRCDMQSGWRPPS